MACPECKCKVTYSYFYWYDGDCEADEPRQKCANCGCIFWPEDALDEDDL